MSSKQTSMIHCDICLGKFEKKSIMYYIKNCREHRIACNVCYKIIKYTSKEIKCPCCENKIHEFIRLPCDEYDIVNEFPFTI